ncbi:MAG: bacteriohemerythrin [Desulfobacterales bacterium]|nr:bacteriohemerythrin [Desulfobacterales bacterium]
MSFFDWEEKYSVGITEIDEQHKKLVGLLNQLHEAMSDGKSTEVIKPVLIGLIEYVKTHFSTEENYLIKYAYPDYESHKKAHDQFTNKVRDLRDKYIDDTTSSLAIEISDFLKDWLVKHIMGTDKLYVSFLKEKGVK